jgi:flagellar assembly protein FliH
VQAAAAALTLSTKSQPGAGRHCPTDQLLLRARELFAEAERQTQQARHSADEIEREAFELGYRQGEKAGQEIGQAKLAPLLAEVEALLRRLAGAHAQVVRANQDQLVEVALTVAARILHRELEQTPEQILHTAEEVLALVEREQRVRLRLSQADFQVLLDHQGQMPALARLGDRLTFEVDPDMIKGGCLVQTPTGSVDATIETMFAEMRRTLTGQRSTFQAPPEDA